MTLRDSGDGSVDGRFRLPTLHADLLRSALDALTSPRRLGDGRSDPTTGGRLSASSLRGRGLMELLEGHLDLTTVPGHAGSPFTVVVTVGLEALQTGLGVAAVDTGCRVSAGEARRLACRAGIIAMVLDRGPGVLREEVAAGRGRGLAQRGYQQAWVFGTYFLFMREVEEVAAKDGRFVARIGGVGEVTARAVVLATGVSYRRLGVPELEAMTGAGVYYGANVSAAQGLTGLDAVVVGGGNSAGQAVLHLAKYCRRVTLVVRGADLGAGMSSYLVEAVGAAPDIVVRLTAEVVGGGGETRLQHVVVRDRVTGEEETLPADGLFVMIGARPRTDWLPPEVARDRFGHVLAGNDVIEAGAWPLRRAPYPYESSVPGLFAVGDVRCGSVKRVASAVGEGSVVVSQVHELFKVPQ